MFNLSFLLEILSEFFLQLTRDYGYLGVFIGSFADSLFPLVPSEVVLGVAGALIYQGVLNPWLALIVSIIGNLLASIVVWYAGHRLGEGLVLKYGKYLQFDEKDLEKSKNIFNKWGYFSVFFCQFIPILRSIISIPSGILKLDITKFLILTAMGATIWNSTIMYIGFTLGANWKHVDEYINKYGKPLFYVAAVIIIIGIIYFYYNKNKINKKDKFGQ